MESLDGLGRGVKIVREGGEGVQRGAELCASLKVIVADHAAGIFGTGSLRNGGLAAGFTAFN